MNKPVLGLLIAAATTASSAAFAHDSEWQHSDDQPTWQPQAIPAAPAPPEYQQMPAPAYAPQAPAVTVTAAPAATGQWVFTDQYGWLWMPYGASYTYVARGDAAYTFAFYPHFGWRWVAAPWVVGYGPTPCWGRLGPSRFAWYDRPAFRGYAHAGWYGRPAHYYREPVVSAPVYYRAAPYAAGRRGGGWHGGHHR